MPDPCTIRFHDYYEAQLAAHQLESEGHRAAVFDFVYGTAPWPSSEYRVIVFENGQFGEAKADGGEPEFGEFESGHLVHCVDEGFRYLTLAGVLTALVLLLGSLISLPAHMTSFGMAEAVEAVIAVAIFALVMTFGIYCAIAAYSSFRQNQPGGFVFVQIGGWSILFSFGNFLVVLFLLLIALIPTLLREEVPNNLTEGDDEEE